SRELPRPALRRNSATTSCLRSSLIRATEVGKSLLISVGPCGRLRNGLWGRASPSPAGGRGVVVEQSVPERPRSQGGHFAGQRLQFVRQLVGAEQQPRAARGG